VALLDFTGSPHGGSHKLLPEWRAQSKITPLLILDHTIVGTALGAWWYFHDSTGIESHFIVRGRQSGSANGHIWQLMDTGREADANWDANDKAISIETEDNGADPIEPWSPAQLASLVWLHNKLATLHPTIRRAEAVDCDGPGLGYHAKLGAPSCWTPARGKTCPASARISQWRSVLLPAFLHPKTEEDDMTPEQAAQLKAVHDALLAQHAINPADPIDALYDAVHKTHRALIVPGTTNAEDAFNLLFARVRNIEDKVEAIAAALPDPTAEPPPTS
jgi:hypothetical protein